MNMKTIEQMKRHIEQEIELVPVEGVTGEHGDWTSQKDEIERLRKLHSEICYFVRQYGY